MSSKNSSIAKPEKRPPDSVAIRKMVADVLPPEGEFCIQSITNEKTEPRHLYTRDVDKIVRFCEKWSVEGRATFFCVSSVTGRGHKKSDAKLTLAINLDTDLKDIASSADEVIALLLALELPPTKIVKSGNGIHAYWILAAPATPGADTEAIQKKLAGALAGDMMPTHCTAMMRMPGTFNTKNGQWRKAEVAHDDGRRYRLDELEAWDAPATILKKAAEPADAYTQLGDAHAYKAPIDVDERLAAMTYRGEGDTAIHPTQLSVTASMMVRGFDEDEIVETVLQATKDAVGDLPWNWKDEEKTIRGMCRDARDWIEKRKKDAAAKVAHQHGDEAMPIIPNPREMLTDLGNARRLVRVHGDDLRYIHARGLWLAWEDGRWRKDDNGFVARKAKAAIEEMFAEAMKINDETRRTATRKHALASQSAARLGAMVMLAQTEPEVVLSVSKLDADPMLLGVENGVVDLHTGEFRETHREDYVTKIAGTAFDARARCPNWLKFLKTVLPDPELVRYLQRACGYVLTGATGEEVLFVLWGRGKNGKSTFRETLFALMGDYAVGSDASLLVTNKRSGGATPDLVRLLAQRLVTINETEKNDVLNEARVKYITSHDKITARDLYESYFDFTPTHKTFLTTNDKPIVRGAGEGTWRRIHLIPFLVKIEDPDVTFRERVLMPELPGILNWALEGLAEYQRIGLAPPAAVLDATNEYREDMDLIGRWIEERCDLDPEAMSATAELHVDYESWARDEIGFSMSVINFGRELSARGFDKVRIDRRTKGVRGLKLSEGESDPYTNLDPRYARR